MSYSRFHNIASFTVVFLFLLLVIHGQPWAGTEADQIQKKVVQAIEIGQQTQKKEIEEAPGSIEVITSQEIEDIGAQTVAEALEKATGLIVTGTTGRVRRPSIRGTGNKHTLVLIDGRRLSMGYKDFLDVNQISVDMIERIEVVRGPSSALYGSDAIGGVVNIITKAPPRELAMGATFQYGISTYGEGEEPLGRAYVGDSFKGFGFLLAGSYRDKNEWDRDGVIPDDGDDKELGSIAGRFSFDLDDNHTLLAGFEYSDMDRAAIPDAKHSLADILISIQISGQFM